MRYFRSRKAIQSIANVFRGKRFHPEAMSRYMLSDIGFIDGRPPVCEGGFAAADARLHRFDQLVLTPYAS